MSHGCYIFYCLQIRVRCISLAKDIYMIRCFCRRIEIIRAFVLVASVSFYLRRPWICSAHFISFIFIGSFLKSTSNRDLNFTPGLPVNGFHLCILLTMLVSGILFMCPNQLSLCILTSFIMFRCFFNSSNSLFVLILQIPLTSLVGQNVFLNIFLSNTESLYITLSLRTHISQP